MYSYRKRKDRSCPWRFLNSSRCNSSCGQWVSEIKYLTSLLALSIHILTSSIECRIPIHCPPEGIMKVFSAVTGDMFSTANSKKDQRWLFEEGNKYKNSFGWSKSPSVSGKNVHVCCCQDSDDQSSQCRGEDGLVCIYCGLAVTDNASEKPKSGSISQYSND
jgi:hypothetical protein